MGKRKKTASEPQKGMPPTLQQAVNVVLEKPEEDSNSSALSSTSATTSSNETNNIVHAEMPSSVPSVQLLQNDIQVYSKTQINDVSTPESRTKEDSGATQNMNIDQPSTTESSSRKDDTLPLEQKDLNRTPEINNYKDEIMKNSTVAKVTAPVKALHPSEKIIEENKSNAANENSSPDENTVETISQKNNALTTQTTISVAVQQETAKLGAENTSVNTSLPQTEHLMTDAKNLAETKNVSPFEGTSKEFNSTKLENQGAKADLSSSECDKEYLTMPGMSKPNPVSSNNASINKICQESNQKSPLPITKEEVEASELTFSDESIVLSTEEKALQDTTAKNLTDNKTPCAYPKQSIAEKVISSKEAIGKQKPFSPQENQPQTSPEKEKSSHPTGNKTDTEIGRADSMVSVSQIENPTLSTENIQIPSILPTTAFPKKDIEFKNIVDKNEKTEFQNEKSFNSSVSLPEQTVPDQSVVTVKANENRTSLSCVSIQKHTDEISTTGNESVSNVSGSEPVAVEFTKTEFPIETVSQCVSKYGITLEKSDMSSKPSVAAKDEYLKSQANSITGSAQMSTARKSDAQSFKVDNTAPKVKPEGNKSDEEVKESLGSARFSKDINASHQLVANESTSKTVTLEGIKEATLKYATKSELSTSKSHDKEGSNLEVKSDEKKIMIGKTEMKSCIENANSTPDKSPGKKTNNKKEVNSTKKGVSESAKKLDDLTSKKLGLSVSVTNVTVDDNEQNDSKEKESSITNSQGANTSKPIKDNEPLSFFKDVGTKTLQKQGVVGEVKTTETGNKTKNKQSEIKDVAHKSSTPCKTVVGRSSAKADSGLASENKRDENSVSKKAKSNKSSQKVTNAQTQNISGSEHTQSTISPGSDKEINKSVPETKSERNSGLLGLMQEVLEVIGKNNETGEKSETVNKDQENETKKLKKSKSRKRSKPKESSEIQENNGKVKSQQEFVKEPKAVTNATIQTPKSNESKDVSYQKIKPEKTINESEDTGKDTVKSKKGKRSTGKNKEDSKQSDDKTKQKSTRNKTNQPSTVDLISNPTSLDELKGDGGTVVDIMKDGQTVQETSQPKKKRKHRKNKSKPSGNEEENKIIEDKENNESAPDHEALAGIKKNSNRIKSIEKISIDSTNEINKNILIKKPNLEIKHEEIKQQKVSAIFSGEQLNHLTRTAVNLSQSLGDSDSFNSKLTPDIMRSLLAPKAIDIFSTPEDDEEVEYRMVQRQIFLSYVCHVCKSMESKTCSLKKCNNCKLISYCSKKHQKDHWSAHKDMCTAITNVCKHEGLSHLFQNALGLVPNDYRLYRTYYVNLCTQELGRELQLWEKEMIYYPQVCHTCYDCEVQKLRTCQNCSHISYCSADHRKTDHDIWCKEFQIYRDITLHQFHNGMIRPILPERVFDENVPVTGNMESFLSKVFNITEKSVQMSKLHFVALTDVATCPFTVLFSLQTIDFPVKDTNSLVVHLLGAEMFFEIDSIRKWEMFLLHLIPSIKILKIVFVGPELSVDGALVKSLSETKVCHSCSSSGRKLVYQFWPGLYHDFMRSELYGKPDLICAFNSGLYRPVDFAGMDTWSATIEALFKNSSIPVVVTEYTEQELPLDIARIQTINNSVDIIMSPTRNPFSSMKPSLNFLSEEKVPVIFKNFYISIMKTLVQ